MLLTSVWNSELFLRPLVWNVLEFKHVSAATLNKKVALNHF